SGSLPYTASIRVASLALPRAADGELPAEHLLEARLQDLARRVPRQLLHDDEPARRLIGRRALTTPGCQLRRVHLPSCDDEGDGDLASLGVGPPDDGDLSDSRVREKKLLDLDGIEFHTLVVDHVVRPALEVKEAVSVDRGEVAGIEPAVAKGSPGRLR